MPYQSIWTYVVNIIQLRTTTSQSFYIQCKYDTSKLHKYYPRMNTNERKFQNVG
jgi:hypothetical protein